MHNINKENDRIIAKYPGNMPIFKIFLNVRKKTTCRTCKAGNTRNNNLSYSADAGNIFETPKTFLPSVKEQI